MLHFFLIHLYIYSWDWIYWNENAWTLFWILDSLYARSCVLGRNAKKYEKKDDGSQPPKSETPAPAASKPKKVKPTKRPAETEVDDQTEKPKEKKKARKGKQ